MSEPVNLEAIMGLIMYGGDAKGKAIEAIEAAKENDFETAEAKIAEASESLVTAHQSQTSLLTNEAQGESMEVSLLLIHGQDHLMNAITFIDLAKEVIDIHKKFAALEK
ncbi:PTS lactose/cellobiose transporter subunit IIA [Ruoffia tabacinasalis]|uniref:PTS lactose/cellobiose transporter subunit IIA n=1 Tax=Ruoffia tabacinasalis TaxID=87458 RepID=A0ABS0LJ99_9LACT|nr:PTS lactose/cellobiose transporter subunit IIA [Ruoffia tabacinasalis]MBG9978229.1 PTS lactose/cellobiose transporter subunit IIA [Ruoffia tabacinasalis]